MLTFLLAYSLFPIALFFLAAFLVTGLPVLQALQSFYANRGQQSVTCPETGEPVNIAVDREYAFWSALRGQGRSRAESCSRWPEKRECGQECLAQVDPSPENIERLLSKWFEGKRCAICVRALKPSDWQQSRLGLLDTRQKLVEMRQLELRNLQAALRDARPLCWGCHQDERGRQAVTDRMYKTIVAT